MKKSAFRMMLVAAAAWSVSGCATSEPTRDADTAADANADIAASGTPRVHVVFANSEKFTDARSSLSSGTDPRTLDPLGRFLVREASKHLAPGERLTIVFNDVDLAGDFELGGVSSTGDIRIMREIYPPRLEFNYAIVDQTDTVVQKGDVTLTNRDFLRALRPLQSQQEPLYHEKQMLREWIRKTLQDRRAG